MKTFNFYVRIWAAYNAMLNLHFVTVVITSVITEDGQPHVTNHEEYQVVRTGPITLDTVHAAVFFIDDCTSSESLWSDWDDDDNSTWEVRSVRVHGMPRALWAEACSEFSDTEAGRHDYFTSAVVHHPQLRGMTDKHLQSFRRWVTKHVTALQPRLKEFKGGN